MMAGLGYRKIPGGLARMADELRCTIDNRIATVTLNRPEKRNALNRAVIDGLTATFADLDKNDDVRAVVVRGAGKAFCSGMDLDELRRRQAEEADPESIVVDVLHQIEQCRHPTIAMINGDAFAGGCELALHCDLRIAADVARFAMPLARIGLIVPFTLGQKLLEVIGPAYTREILLTGRPVDATRAREMGLVHQVVPLDALDTTVSELTASMADLAPLSLAGMKQTILRAISTRESIPHADLDDLAKRARKSDDAREGVRAMLEKRRPRFTGR
jgi:enoyl-CoA hydratase/carnithine racemase